MFVTYVWRSNVPNLFCTYVQNAKAVPYTTQPAGDMYRTQKSSPYYIRPLCLLPPSAVPRRLTCQFLARKMSTRNFYTPDQLCASQTVPFTKIIRGLGLGQRNLLWKVTIHLKCALYTFMATRKRYQDRYRKLDQHDRKPWVLFHFSVSDHCEHFCTVN